MIWNWLFSNFSPLCMPHQSFITSRSPSVPIKRSWATLHSSLRPCKKLHWGLGQIFLLTSWPLRPLHPSRAPFKLKSVVGLGGVNSMSLRPKGWSFPGSLSMARNDPLFCSSCTLPRYPVSGASFVGLPRVLSKQTSHIPQLPSVQVSFFCPLSPLYVRL